MPTVSQETQTIISEALDKLRARGVTHDYCPRCSTADWNVDLLGVPAISLPNPNRHLVPHSGYLSVLAIACKNCGYTMFHNLNVLGVQVEQ